MQVSEIVKEVLIDFCAGEYATMTIKQAEKLAKMVEEKFTSTNTTRSEIAAICIELDCCMYEKFTKEMYVELRKRLRQLSSVV